MFRSNYICLYILLSVFLFTGCSDNSSDQSAAGPTGPALFQLLTSATTGVRFQNNFVEDYEFNILTYEYLYNGGGVAIGDINNDGLPDLYFSATFAPNKLFLNKGNMTFEDITETAGVAADQGFKTGVSMADLNNDGLLDIFVCRTGKDDNGLKDNLIYINQGNLTFKESGEQLGLRDNSNTNHVAFLDYDLDGDLDIYLLNHRIGFKTATQLRLQQELDGSITRKTEPETPFESDRLFRNDNGSFTDVSQAAGIINSSFGLSVTVADINKDGYPDLFIGNDYIEPDYVYINQQNGTFADTYSYALRHSSQNTMGADIADINNDGLPDIMSLDMIAEDPVRYKELMNVMQYDRYQMLARYGYGHQVGRNVLHLNNGNGTFSEIGQFAGLAATDWSWATLIADFDNDSWADVYITNGYRRDVTNLDYMTFTRDSIERTGRINPTRFPDINTVLNLIPEQKVSNYIYQNKGELRFQNQSAAWGIEQPSYSNGAAYGDLDADGDLDLVVNNIGEEAFIFENREGSKNNYLQLKLVGPANNKLALGASVSFETSTGTHQKELNLNHGFFSTSEALLHFGLGNTNTIEELSITWPDNRVSTLKNISANQRLEVSYDAVEKTSAQNIPVESHTPVFSEESQGRGLIFKHQENEFIDFKREQLLPKKLSTEGPSIAVGDLNNDGLDDLHIGGAAGQAGRIFIQNGQGRFTPVESPAITADAASEDVDSSLFDADGDGDLDLFVVSGGNAFPVNDDKYLDRLYINDGQGTFSKANISIPPSSGGAIHAFDYDGDGDTDVLVGGRVKPGAYPQAPLSYLLQNQGNGRFSEVTNQVFPEFREIGMVTAIQTADLDGDGKTELLVCGEYMPIQVFQFNEAAFENTTEQWGLSQSEGFWNTLFIEDIDGDGKKDIIAGNEGLNTRLKASFEHPLKCYAADFDNNGSIDPILCFYHNGDYFPYAGRDAIGSQLPEIKKRFLRYALYANASVEDILTAEKLGRAEILEARTLENTIWYQENGKFAASPLNSTGQLSPVYSALAIDYNKDGQQDFLLAGNYYGSDTETGVYDAGNGVLLQNNGSRTPSYIPNMVHGFWASREVRALAAIDLADGKKGVVVINNNGPVELHVY